MAENGEKCGVGSDSFKQSINKLERKKQKQHQLKKKDSNGTVTLNI